MREVRLGDSCGGDGQAGGGASSPSSISTATCGGEIGRKVVVEEVGEQVVEIEERERKWEESRGGFITKHQQSEMGL